MNMLDTLFGDQSGDGTVRLGSQFGHDSTPAAAA